MSNFHIHAALPKFKLAEIEPPQMSTIATPSNGYGKTCSTNNILRPAKDAFQLKIFKPLFDSGKMEKCFDVSNYVDSYEHMKVCMNDQHSFINFINRKLDAVGHCLSDIKRVVSADKWCGKCGQYNRLVLAKIKFLNDMILHHISAEAAANSVLNGKPMRKPEYPLIAGHLTIKSDFGKTAYDNLAQIVLKKGKNCKFAGVLSELSCKSMEFTSEDHDVRVVTIFGTKLVDELSLVQSGAVRETGWYDVRSDLLCNSLVTPYKDEYTFITGIHTAEPRTFLMIMFKTVTPAEDGTKEASKMFDANSDDIYSIVKTSEKKHTLVVPQIECEREMMKKLAGFDIVEDDAEDRKISRCGSHYAKNSIVITAEIKLSGTEVVAKPLKHRCYCEGHRMWCLFHHLSCEGGHISHVVNWPVYMFILVVAMMFSRRTLVSIKNWFYICNNPLNAEWDENESSRTERARKNEAKALLHGSVQRDTILKLKELSARHTGNWPFTTKGRYHFFLACLKWPRMTTVEKIRFYLKWYCYPVWIFLFLILVIPAFLLKCIAKCMTSQWAILLLVWPQTYLQHQTLAMRLDGMRENTWIETKYYDEKPVKITYGPALNFESSENSSLNLQPPRFPFEPVLGIVNNVNAKPKIRRKRQADKNSATENLAFRNCDTLKGKPLRHIENEHIKNAAIDEIVLKSEECTKTSCIEKRVYIGSLPVMPCSTMYFQRKKQPPVMLNIVDVETTCDADVIGYQRSFSKKHHERCFWCGHQLCTQNILKLNDPNCRFICWPDGFGKTFWSDDVDELSPYTGTVLRYFRSTNVQKVARMLYTGFEISCYTQDCYSPKFNFWGNSIRECMSANFYDMNDENWFFGAHKLKRCKLAVKIKVITNEKNTAEEMTITEGDNDIKMLGLDGKLNIRFNSRKMVDNEAIAYTFKDLLTARDAIEITSWRLVDGGTKLKDNIFGHSCRYGVPKDGVPSWCKFKRGSLIDLSRKYETMIKNMDSNYPRMDMKTNEGVAIKIEAVKEVKENIDVQMCDKVNVIIGCDQKENLTFYKFSTIFALHQLDYGNLDIKMELTDNVILNDEIKDTIDLEFVKCGGFMDEVHGLTVELRSNANARFRCVERTLLYNLECGIISVVNGDNKVAISGRTLNGQFELMQLYPETSTPSKLIFKCTMNFSRSDKDSLGFDAKPGKVYIACDPWYTCILPYTGKFLKELSLGFLNLFTSWWSIVLYIAIIVAAVLITFCVYSAINQGRQVKKILQGKTV